MSWIESTVQVLWVRGGLLCVCRGRNAAFHHELHWNQGDPLGGLPVMLEKGKGA